MNRIDVINLIDIVMMLVQALLVMFAAIVHEVAHGWAAYKLGDPTAKMQGRLTLNPLAHLDGFGSVVLPLIMALTSGPMIAFAKPVPYNPNNLKDPKKDELLVALAGPFSNLLQAMLGAVIYRLVLRCGGYSITTTIAIYLLSTYVVVNLSLMFFNLLPIPPLDGSSIIAIFTPASKMDSYYKLQAYSMPIFIGLIYLLPAVFNIDPIGSYLGTTVYYVAHLLLGGL